MIYPVLLVALALATIYVFKARIAFGGSAVTLCFIAALTPLIATAAYLLSGAHLAGPPIGIGLIAAGLIAAVTGNLSR